MGDYNDIETLGADQVEEIPPTPIAPEAPEPNFTEAEGGSSSFETYTSEADPDEQTAKVLAIVSLVAGILSLICCCASCIEIPFGIIAVVCGIISIKKSPSSKGMAIAGIACGGVGIVVCVLLIVFAQALGAIGDLVNVQGIDFDEFF